VWKGWLLYVIPDKLNSAVVTAGDVLVAVYCTARERVGGHHGEHGKTPRTPSPLKNLGETMGGVAFARVMIDSVNELIVKRRPRTIRPGPVSFKARKIVSTLSSVAEKNNEYGQPALLAMALVVLGILHYLWRSIPSALSV
jgi:hypothetical protein